MDAVSNKTCTPEPSTRKKMHYFQVESSPPNRLRLVPACSSDMTSFPGQEERVAMHQCSGLLLLKLTPMQVVIIVGNGTNSGVIIAETGTDVECYFFRIAKCFELIKREVQILKKKNTYTQLGGCSIDRCCICPQSALS